MRNLDENPYSPEEARVANYLTELTGIGGGDYPVGFLIASHFELARQRVLLKAKYPEIFHEIAFEVTGDMQGAEPMSEELAERVSRMVDGISTDPNESRDDEDI